MMITTTIASSHPWIVCFHSMNANSLLLSVVVVAQQQPTFTSWVYCNIYPIWYIELVEPNGKPFISQSTSYSRNHFMFSLFRQLVAQTEYLELQLSAQDKKKCYERKTMNGIDE